MIVVYYGVNLSLSLPFCLSSSLHFPSPVLCLCHNPHFHFLHRSSINLFRPLPLPSASSSGLSISPRSTCSCFTSPPPLPASQSRPAAPRLLLLLLLLLRAILLCSRCSARRKYSLFAPPLDMAKEAICALLAILEHFFEAFSPLDLFFAPSPFRPVPRPFPAFLHPGCRRFPSSPASVA